MTTHEITSQRVFEKLHETRGIKPGDILSGALGTYLTTTGLRGRGEQQQALVLAYYPKSQSYQVRDLGAESDFRIYFRRTDYYAALNVGGYEQAHADLLADGPELSEPELLAKAQFTVAGSLLVRLTDYVEATKFARGYRDTHASGQGPNGLVYYVAYRASLRRYMILIAGLGFFYGEEITEQERRELEAALTPAPAPAYQYEVNCGYNDDRPAHFFVTLEEAYAHCQQVLDFKEREDDADWLRRTLQPGAKGEQRLRGPQGLRWIQLLEEPVPAEAPAPKYCLGAQVRVLGQCGFWTVNKRYVAHGEWHYKLHQRVSELTSELRHASAYEGNLGTRYEPNPNDKIDSRPGHNPALAERVQELGIATVEKTDEELEAYTRPFFQGAWASASGLLDTGANWTGWRDLRRLLNGGGQAYYWKSPNRDLLVYTAFDTAGDQYLVPMKGWSVLETHTSYPAYALVARAAKVSAIALAS
jgi:hypothetical protein